MDVDWSICVTENVIGDFSTIFRDQVKHRDPESLACEIADMTGVPTRVAGWK